MTKTIVHTITGLAALTLCLGFAWSVTAQNRDLETNNNPVTEADLRTAAAATTSRPVTERAPYPETTPDQRQVERVGISLDRSTEQTNTLPTRTTERLPLTTNRQAALEARRLAFQADQTERQAALQARAQQRIINLAANISERMEAAIRRLDTVVMRLDDRVSILTERGVDTTAAALEMTRARAEIERARTTLATIDEDIVIFISSENPQASWTQVRTTYATARDAIKAAHTSLRTTVRLLQTAIGTAEVTNTSINE